MTNSTYQIIASPQQLDAAIQLLSQQVAIGVDTETTGLDPYLSRVRLIQLATSKESFIIDLFQSPELILGLTQLLQAPTPIKIFHNAKFDLKMLQHHFGLVVNPVFDTMLASQIITNGQEGESHSLAATVSRFLGMTLDKSAQRSDWSQELTPAQLQYAANDAQILVPLYQAQERQLQSLALNAVAQLEFECVSSLVDMELAGILLDKGQWQAIADRVAEQHQKVANELRCALEPADLQMSLFGESTINLDSPEQIHSHLQRLGIPVLGTRNAQLQPWAEEFPVVKQLLEYRHLQKALTSYGMGMLKFIHPITGRVHADFRQIGTPTGRLSCHDPNIQQIPSSVDYRSCFIAPPGYQLIIADYSQIELRILADWSEDTQMIAALLAGDDLHRQTASHVFQIPVESVTYQQRAAAKQLNYGIVYGMGAAGLARFLSCTLSEAEAFINRYFSTYPGVAQWLENAGKQAVAHRRVYTRLGRLIYLNFDDTQVGVIATLIRVGKNLPIQGTSADIIKEAMILLRKSLLGTSARLVNSIHDELVVEVREDEADLIGERVQSAMKLAAQRWLTKVSVGVDIKIAHAWLK